MPEENPLGSAPSLNVSFPPIAAIGAERHSRIMSEQFWTALLMVCGTAYFGWLIIAGFKRGVMDWPYAGLELTGRREDQPFRFWAVAGCLVLWTSLCFLGTLLVIFFPNGV